MPAAGWAVLLACASTSAASPVSCGSHNSCFSLTARRTCLPAGGWFSGLFGGGGSREQSTAAAAAPAVQGLYMYGGVGVGKTMLMDLLAKDAPAHFRVSGCDFRDW